MATRHLDFFYGDNQALFDNNLDIAEHRVTAIIGPSGCGKSTHLRIYNRIYELYRDQRATGEVLLDGANIIDPHYDIMELRRKIGMIFQKPTPFPMSVFDNVAYGLKLHYSMKKGEMADRVEEALSRAALWDEVKDFLHRPGTALSGGQQQRLCIARALAVEPEVLLMDEPTSAIDPIATAKIEELINRLKEQLFHRHCHPQHAAGRPGLRFHRLLLPGTYHRVRRNPANLYQALSEKDGRVYHRPVRVMIR